MWTVIYMSSNKDLAFQTIDLLEKEGIMFRMREIKKRKNISESHFEILVLKTEIEEAHQVIVEKGY